MINNMRLKKAVNNTISVMGVLDTDVISSLEIDLIEMSAVLDNQAFGLISETESCISIQSKLIEQNCLTQIERSIENISSSLSDTTINSVKKVLIDMNSKISDIEYEMRKRHTEDLNKIHSNKHKRNEFIENLKKTNTKAIILFDGNDLRENILDMFISQDSQAMETEKDNMISSVITYVDLSVKRYNEYIDKLQHMISIIDDTDILRASCKCAKELLFSYPKDYLLAKTPEELNAIVLAKVKEVL